MLDRILHFLFEKNILNGAQKTCNFEINLLAYKKSTKQLTGLDEWKNC